MCGIAGCVTKGNFEVSPGQIDRLTGALAHRGPDGEGRLRIDDTILIHKRLAVIDLKTGAQPFQDKSGVCLIANGEIYNYQELSEDIDPNELSTRSDCELPLHLYKRHGVSFTDHLRGMYALAIYDPEKRELILSRDPFGIKPLYYVSHHNYFAFASEPQALIESNFASRRPSISACKEMLNKQFISGRRSGFEEISRVLPGETLVVRSGEIVDTRYTAALSERFLQGGNLISLESRLDDLLAETIELHQRSDVPYGMFLSGGIDSSALLAMMARLNPRPVLTYTASFDAKSVINESVQARKVARTFGASNIEVTVTQKDFWNDLPSIAAIVDDPCADYAIIPTYALAREAAKDVKVILSGEGGDESFAGYGRYRRALRPSWMGGRQTQRNALFDELRTLRNDGAEQSDDHIKPIFRDKSRYTHLQRLQAEDFVDWLPHNLLLKLDRCLMAYGLEGRTPFVDKVLTNFAFCLPDYKKVTFRLGKKILRTWLNQQMPHSESFARKKGFTVPVAEWLENQRHNIGELVSSQPGVKQLCVPGTVGPLFNSRNKRAVQASWRLLFFSLWHRRHILGLPPEGDVFECLSASSEH